MSTKFIGSENISYIAAINAVNRYGYASTLVIQSEDESVSQNQAINFLDEMHRNGLIEAVCEDGTHKLIA